MIAEVKVPTRLTAWFDKGAPVEVKRYGGHIYLDDTQEHGSVLSLTDAPGAETHLPLLDDDNGYFRVIPSSTPGHQHVYIDKPITWDQWKRLLVILAELELVDPKWAEASIAQGTATLRLPGHFKSSEEVTPKPE